MEFGTALKKARALTGLRRRSGDKWFVYIWDAERKCWLDFRESTNYFTARDRRKKLTEELARDMMSGKRDTQGRIL